ncbi:hypothetical protein [Acidovorax sp. BLS4]|uniref:hypothetical protein n=1 Tax=Acidovorax sp. BLS4 TaxID=3273430 RepID=UPI002942B185|nr:hypothetical protein [Paracidovorax avenae]WOI45632.1 hypothetical protein R1Z03_24900 [Paracidovorax avenae]
MTPLVNARLPLTPAQLPLLFFAVFFVIGFLLAALMRGAVGEITGHRVGIVDRAAGAFLGAFRVVLLAVLITLIYCVCEIVSKIETLIYCVCKIVNQHNLYNFIPYHH